MLKPEYGSTPGEQQQLAYEQFPSTAASSSMSLWGPGETIATRGTRVLIGVASYSIQDLKLLDALDLKLSVKTDRSETIQLFDVLNCTEMDDFEKYIPGIGKVFQTPVLGVWEDGNLQYKAAGWPATKWLTARYDLTLI